MTRSHQTLLIPETHQAQEEWHVVVHKLGQVHVAKRPHQHQLLRHAGRAALERACHDKHALQGAQAKVIMVLLGQLLGCQLVQHSHLLGQQLRTVWLRRMQPCASQVLLGPGERQTEESATA